MNGCRAAIAHDWLWHFATEGDPLDFASAFLLFGAQPTSTALPGTAASVENDPNRR